MIRILDENINKIETINLTKHTLPVVISMPHSGIYFSENMQKDILENVIFSNMDWYLPQFYDFLKEMDFTIIKNNISRYVIDPNRAITQKNIDGKYSDNLIYTKTTFGKEIYKIAPNSSEIESRINDFYISYHHVLEQAINDKLKYFDKVYLIDLHSFGKDVSADIVLGNDNGNATSNFFIQTMDKLLKEQGFYVQNNVPYSGGYITRHYGNSINKCEALQIELSYKAYIDNREFLEEEFPNINEVLFKNTQKKMKTVFKNFINILNVKEIINWLKI